MFPINKIMKLNILTFWERQNIYETTGYFKKQKQTSDMHVLFSWDCIPNLALELL